MEQQQTQMGIMIFYSYAHEDEQLRDQLEMHLSLLRRQGYIAEWHDRKIVAGEVWKHSIDVHMEAASVILLLISPDFLASDYCYDIEMQRALERHKRGEACVIPIFLCPVDWTGAPFAHLQGLPSRGKPVTEWENQDVAFRDVVQGIRRAIEQQHALARPTASLSLLHQQNRIRMLRQVRAIWIDGLLAQSLHHVADIEIRLQDRPNMLANPWRLLIQELDQTPQPLPDGTTTVQVYDRAGGELLLLGEPGAGKTTLLLELTRTLLERAEQDEQARLPVVFNLSSWAEKRRALGVWLIEELRAKYQVPRKIGQEWVDTDQVLPLLDGLDEVAEEARVACMQAINIYYQSCLEEHGYCPMVVCCRGEEYAALSTRVTLQHAVSILPLTDEQVTLYLERAGEQVKGLGQALDEDPELRSLARQPLMLNIFTLAFQGAQASEVPTGETREEVQHAIFVRYIERMLKRRKQSKDWALGQMIRWLTFLARQMQRHDQTVFSVENLQPTWLSRQGWLLYQCSLGLFRGLICGLVGGLIGVITGELASSQGGALVLNLVGGASSCSAACWIGIPVTLRVVRESASRTPLPLSQRRYLALWQKRALCWTGGRGTRRTDLRADLNSGQRIARMAACSAGYLARLRTIRRNASWPRSFCQALSLAIPSLARR